MRTFFRYFTVALACLIGGVALGWWVASGGPGSLNPRPQGEPTAAPSGDGWLALFEGEHATQWANVTDDMDIFALEDGVLHIYGRTITPLRYVGYEAERFDHFELHVAFMLTEGANSGLFLRMQPNDPVNRGFEVQVLEDHGALPSVTGCGSIYDVVTPMYNLVRPPGEWNSYDITVQGDRVRVVFNGWTVIDTDFSKMTTPLGKFEVAYAEMQPDGLIAFQDHGGEVWYRNLYVRPLPDPDADTPAADAAPTPESDAGDA